MTPAPAVAPAPESGGPGGRGARGRPWARGGSGLGFARQGRVLPLVDSRRASAELRGWREKIAGTIVEEAVAPVRHALDEDLAGGQVPHAVAHQKPVQARHRPLGAAERPRALPRPA